MKTTAIAALILPAIASAHSVSRRGCDSTTTTPVFKIKSYLSQTGRQPSCMARGQVYKSGDIMYEDENCESTNNLFTWHPKYTNQIVLLDENMSVTDHCMMNLGGKPEFSGERVAVLGDQAESHGNCDSTNSAWETVVALENGDEPVVLIKDSKSGLCLMASEQEYADNSQTPDLYTLAECNNFDRYQRFQLEVQCDKEFVDSVVIDAGETIDEVTIDAGSSSNVADCYTGHPVFTISSYVSGNIERLPSCVARGQVYKSGDIMYEDMDCKSEQRFAWHPDFDNQFVALDENLAITDHCMMIKGNKLDFTGKRVPAFGQGSRDNGKCDKSNAVWETIDVAGLEKQEVVQIKDDKSKKCLQASNQEYADNSQTPDEYILAKCDAANELQQFVLRVDCRVSPAGY